MDVTRKDYEVLNMTQQAIIEKIDKPVESHRENVALAVIKRKSWLQA